MIISFLIILVIALSGAIVTYFYESEDSFLNRLAAGNIIGSAIFGLIVFLAACVFGFNSATLIFSILITLSPLLLLKKDKFRQKFSADFAKAKAQLENANLSKLLNFVYFLFFLILFYFFFERAIFETPEGIFTGGSNNLGDLPFHLGAVFSFTEGNNFPPENPSFAFAKFTYPFMADLIAAAFVKLGATVRDAFLVQNITLVLSLIVLFEKFVFSLVRDKKAGKIAVFLLMFSGGLGFILFHEDWQNDGRGFFEFINHLSMDYTIRDKILRWGNSLTTLFITQRGFLLGMPLTLIVLNELWKLFSNRKKGNINNVSAENQNGNLSLINNYLPLFFIGLLAGTLPLIHVHSLVVLFIISAFLMIFSVSRLREWVIFGIGVCLIAVPELIWTLTGSATNVGKFIGWHLGWEADEDNVFVFWLKNTGFLIPLLFVAIFILAGWINKQTAEDTNAQVESANKAHYKNLLLFYIPFLLIFLIGNTVKLAPWAWDNIKILIYWFAASIPFVAWLLARFWEGKFYLKIIAAVCFAALIFAGFLDVWRTISGQIKYEVFDRDAINLAQQIKQKTAPNAMFLNAPAYNSPIVLTGRRSLMRYIGHISSYGINYEPRYEEMKQMYEGLDTAKTLLEKHKIDYVITNPDDAGWVMTNEEFWRQYPVIAESGKYRVYQVRKVESADFHR